MPVATAKDRVKASRARKAIRDGTATDDQRRFLAGYEATYGGPAKSRAPKPPAPAPETGAQAGAGAGPPPEPQAPPAVQGETGKGASMAEPTVPIDFGPPPGSVGASPPAGALAPAGGPASAKCSNPQCSCNKGAWGAYVCPVTGAKTWPPMDPEVAEAAGETLLRGIAFVVFLVRKVKVVPTEREISRLGKSIKLIQERRASWLGAVDDLVMFGSVVGGFTIRAVRATGEEA